MVPSQSNRYAPKSPGGNFSFMRRMISFSRGYAFLSSIRRSASWTHSSTVRASFVAQGDHGIDSGCAARGNVARQQGGEQEHGGDRSDGCRINSIDLVQDGFHQTPDKVRAGQAHPQTNQCEQHTFPNYQTKHLLWTCAERNAQSDFVSALGDGERHHAINADGRKEEGEGRKTGEERG